MRGLLGDWLARPDDAGRLTRDMGLEMARIALEASHDVVVPQFLARAEFILELEALAAATSSMFVEIALCAPVDDVVQWLAKRSSAPQSISHDDAQALLDQSGGIHELRRMVDRWETLVAGRPHVHRIPARVGDLANTYAQLERIVASHAAN